MVQTEHGQQTEAGHEVGVSKPKQITRADPTRNCESKKPCSQKWLSLYRKEKLREKRRPAPGRERFRVGAGVKVLEIYSETCPRCL